MASKKKKKKFGNSSNLNAVIILLLILAVAVAVALVVLKGCQFGPETPSATPAPENTSAQETQTPLSTEPAAQTADPGDTSEPTEPPTEPPYTEPVLPFSTQPLSVSEDEVAALHITVDTGFTSASQEQVFDDFYKLLDNNGTIDLSDIRLIVYLTDYRGNVRAYRFASMDVIVSLPGFRFSADTQAVDVEEAAEIRLFVNDADNAQVTWASQTVKVVNELEAQAPTELHYTCEQGTINLTIRNIGLLLKAELLD